MVLVILPISIMQLWWGRFIFHCYDSLRLCLVSYLNACHLQSITPGNVPMMKQYEIGRQKANNAGLSNIFVSKSTWGKINDGFMQKRWNSSALAMKLCLLNRLNASISATKLHLFALSHHYVFKIVTALDRYYRIYYFHSIQIHSKHCISNNLSHWARPCLDT